MMHVFKDRHILSRIKFKFFRPQRQNLLGFSKFLMLGIFTSTVSKHCGLDWICNLLAVFWPGLPWPCIRTRTLQCSDQCILQSCRLAEPVAGSARFRIRTGWVGSGLVTGYGPWLIIGLCFKFSVRLTFSLLLSASLNKLFTVTYSPPTSTSRIQTPRV